MLDKVRTVLRITHNKLDDELTDVINACVYDLTIAGVEKINQDDPLIQQAIKTYAKLQYETEPNKIDRLTQAYNSLKIALALCGDYEV